MLFEFKLFLVLIAVVIFNVFMLSGPFFLKDNVSLGATNTIHAIIQSKLIEGICEHGHISLKELFINFGSTPNHFQSDEKLHLELKL